MNSSIAIITDDFYPPRTGVGVVLKPLAIAFQNSGLKTIVITSRAKGQPEYEELFGIRIYRLPSIRLFGFLQAIPNRRKISEILKQNEIEIVYHNYISLLAWRSSQVARRLGLKQIFTFHMTVDLLTQPIFLRPLRSVFQFFIDRFCAGMDFITAPSKVLAQELTERYHQTVSQIGNPLPQIHQLVERRYIVLYVGRLDEEKNLQLLIRAFAKFLVEGGDGELWIAGAGRMRVEWEDLAQSLGIGERTRFLGWVHRELIGNRYDKASVFVLPSRLETQGLVAVEAMSSGLPVIMCRHVGAADELIRHGVNGYLVGVNEVDELAEHLLHLHAHPEIRKSMGVAGKKFCNDPEFSTDVIANQYCRLFQSIS